MTKTQQKLYCPVCKTVAMNDISITVEGSYFQCPKCGYEAYGNDLSTGKFNVTEHFFCASDKQILKPACQRVKCENFAQCRPGYSVYGRGQLR